MVGIGDEELPDLVARLEGESDGNAMEVDHGLGFVANRRLGVAILIPHGNDDESKQHAVEQTDHREFEPRHLIVELEALHA